MTPALLVASCSHIAGHLLEEVIFPLCRLQNGNISLEEVVKLDAFLLASLALAQI